MWREAPLTPPPAPGCPLARSLVTWPGHQVAVTSVRQKALLSCPSFWMCPVQTEGPVSPEGDRIPGETAERHVTLAHMGFPKGKPVAESWHTLE